jgi:hypothetical protein
VKRGEESRAKSSFSQNYVTLRNKKLSEMIALSEPRNSELE